MRTAGALEALWAGASSPATLTGVDLLNPTTDLVFKLLLLRSPDLILVRSMLDCVLCQSSPVESIEILNPDIEKDYPVDKPITLDLRVDLKNRSRVDIEMQAKNPAGTRSRFLYYWARDYGSDLQRGDKYTVLLPTISILWLKENLFEAKQFHGVFHLSEDTTRERFSSDLELHTLELQKLYLLSLPTSPAYIDGPGSSPPKPQRNSSAWPRRTPSWTPPNAL